MYDRQCTKCGCQLIDCWEPITVPDVKCPKCEQPTTRVWLTAGANVIQDSIEGGIEIRHGICNADGTPKRYYTKSDIRAAAKAKGLRICDDLPDAKPNAKRVYVFQR